MFADTIFLNRENKEVEWVPQWISRNEELLLRMVFS
jgi:hypothetical protein